MKEKLLSVFKKENVRVRNIDFDGHEFFMTIDGELNYIRARRFITLNNWTIETNGFKNDCFYIEGSFEDAIVSRCVTKNIKIGETSIIYKAYKVKIIPVENMINGYYYMIGNLKFTDKIFYSVEELIDEAKSRIDGLASKSSELRKKSIANSKAFESVEIMTLKEIEREYIRHALEVFCENRTKVAKALGLSPRTLRNKIGQYANEGDLFFNRLYLETEHMGPNK